MEVVSDRATVLRINPTRDLAKALWSLMFAGVCFFALVAILSHWLDGREAVPFYVPLIFGSIIVGFSLVAFSNALWIWFGTWELKLSEAGVSVQAGLLGKDWKYQYPRELVKSVHIKIFKRKGMVGGRRVVASVRGREVNLSPYVTEQEAFQVIASMKSFGIQ